MNARAAIAALAGAGALVALARRRQSPTAPAVAAGLTAASIPLIARTAAGDRELFWTLVAAHQLRLCAAVVRLHVDGKLYKHIRTDVDDYHAAGAELAARFRAGRFDPRLGSRPGMGAIRFLTGVVYTVTGPSRLKGSLVFACVGFWGLVVFYRAFVLAVPEGDHSAYLLLLLFLPSLLYFPSTISKEPWMLLALGLAALGGAELFRGNAPRGLVLGAAGTGLAATMRPHMAAMLAASLALGGASRLRGRALLAPAAGAGIFTAWTALFLRRWGLEGAGGIEAVWRRTAERGGYGDSKFDPPFPGRLRDLPVVAASVLFRPHLLEARSPQTRAVAIESSLLALLTAARLRSAPRDPYSLAAVAYTSFFTLGYSFVSNFGALARQRTQLVPFYLVPVMARRP